MAVVFADGAGVEFVCTMLNADNALALSTPGFYGILHLWG